MKVILIFIAILIISIFILVLIIKAKDKTIKNKNKEIDVLQKQCNDKETQLNLMNREVEIEKRYNKELMQKLSEISSMSIDDVLHELQNDSNRKDDSVCTGS